MKSHQIKKSLSQRAKKTNKALLLSFIVGILMLPTFALAQTQEAQQDMAKSGGFSMWPSNPTTLDYYNVILELKPGQSTTENLSIQSLEPSEADFNFYAIDFVTKENGTKTYKQKNEPRENVAAWSTLSTENLSLKPNEKKNLDLTISVPSNTPLGDYRGGIAIETLQPSAKYPGIKIARRYIMSVKIKVTDTPQVLARAAQANIFTSIPLNVWISIGIFIASMAYFIYAQKSEKNAKLKDSKK